MRPIRFLLIPALACVVASSSALAGGPNPIPPGGQWANEHLGNWKPNQPGYGFEFTNVGRPGNRAPIQSELVGFNTLAQFPNLGRVDYEYRISTTEVTATQWAPFYEAVLFHWQRQTGLPGLDPRIMPEHFEVDLGTPLGVGITPGEERSAVRTSWDMAARYVNWLHNGAPTGLGVADEVFTTGAYDLPPLFTEDPDAYPVTHNAGAKYWLPTLDEWVKAAHYDPNRYGEGEEGYWEGHAGQSDPLTSGLPWQGGTTSAGGDDSLFDNRNQDAIPVAAYGDVVSPWGLLDTSGQETEWTETVGQSFDMQDASKRMVLGTGQTVYSFPLFYDPLDGVLVKAEDGQPIHGFFGFRIATAAPAPGASSLLALGALLTAGKGRRRSTFLYPG